MKRSVVLLLLCIEILFAKKWRDAIEFDGSMDVGMSVEEKRGESQDSYGVIKRKPERILQGELDFSITISPFISASMDIQSDINEESAKIKKGFITLNFAKHSRLRLGSMRKVVGFEESSAKRKRLLVARSALHDYVSSFSGLGYDYQFQYRYTREASDKRLRLWFGSGADADTRVFINTAGEFVSGKLTLLLSALYVNHEILLKNSNYLLGFVSFRYKGTRHYTEQEISLGRDPHKTDLFKRMGDEQSVVYLGGRSLYRYSFPVKHHLVSSIDPLLQLTIVQSDLNKSVQKIALTPGLTFVCNPKKRVRWITDISLLFSRGEIASGEITFDAVQARSAVQVQW